MQFARAEPALYEMVHVGSACLKGLEAQRTGHSVLAALASPGAVILLTPFALAFLRQARMFSRWA